MKLSTRQRLNRRDLLQRLGASALALPFLELFEGEARAQARPGLSKYAVFLYTPNGVNQRTFWPTGTENTFTLSTVLAPFEPFKNKMLILGPQMDGANLRAGSGLAYLKGPPPSTRRPSA